MIVSVCSVVSVAPPFANTRRAIVVVTVHATGVITRNEVPAVEALADVAEAAPVAIVQTASVDESANVESVEEAPDVVTTAVPPAVMSVAHVTST